MARSDDKNTCLVVSGDKTRITRYTEILNRHLSNCSVFHAADWFDTKYKIDNVLPKIMLIDEYLPKGSGLEVVSKVLKEKNNDNISIIIMSYVADHDLFPNETASGRVQFLTEPEREGALVECLSRIVAPKKEEGPSQYTLRHLSAGDVLFQEGESPQLAYIVKNGQLRAYSESESGERITLGEIKSGEFVGEMGHFMHEPRSATVEAVTDVDLIEIPLNALDNVIFSRPSWARALVKTLAQRLKRANKALTG